MFIMAPHDGFDQHGQRRGEVDSAVMPFPAITLVLLLAGLRRFAQRFTDILGDVAPFTRIVGDSAVHGFSLLAASARQFMMPSSIPVLRYRARGARQLSVVSSGTQRLQVLRSTTSRSHVHIFFVTGAASDPAAQVSVPTLSMFPERTAAIIRAILNRSLF